MQFAAQPKPPLGILFDSAMGARIDDALALSFLYGLDGKNEIRVVGLTVSRSNLSAAAFADAVARFYAGPVNAAFNSFGRTLPVGMLLGGKIAGETPMLHAPLAKTKPDGSPLYVHGVRKLNDTADPLAVIRNALSAQFDLNAAIVLGGPATTLAKVLSLQGAKDLIARKVRHLVISAGAADSNSPDPNTQADVPAMKKLLAEWPTPVFLAGAELGAALPYPAASIEKDFAWTPDHPVADAYRAFHPMPYDADTQNLAAVLQAAHPDQGYFEASEPGTASVSGNGQIQWSPAPSGAHRRLLFDPTQKDRILKLYTALVSAKPVPKAPPFRRPKPADLKPADLKPEEKKP